jgi:hypothetical protein
MQNKTLKLTFNQFIDTFNQFPELASFSMEVICYDEGWEISVANLTLIANSSLDIDEISDEVNEYLRHAYSLGEIDNYGNNHNSDFFYHLAHVLLTPSTIKQKAIEQIGVDKYNQWSKAKTSNSNK